MNAISSSQFAHGVTGIPRDHDVAPTFEQGLAGPSRVRVLVVGVQRKCPSGREVDALPEPDRLFALELDWKED